MSIVNYILETGCGEIDKDNGMLVIYPRRVLSGSMLKEILSRLQDEGFNVGSDVDCRKPIMVTKKKKIDMTEVFMKFFALSQIYDVTEMELKAKQTSILFSFIYKGVRWSKEFDVEMLAAMEKDYVTNWFENFLDKIDEDYITKYEKDSEDE